MSALNGISGTYCSILNNVKSCPGINIKFVRYRKPRFVPKAPSKLYRVKEPNKVDPVESPLIGNWQNRYNTEVKSIRSYLVNYQAQIEERRKIIIGQKKPFEELYAEMKEKNENWNVETAVLKKQAYEEKQKLAEQRLQAVAEREERERAEMLDDARRKVIDYKQHQHNYIQEEDIDNKIEELLNTKSDHNFALFLDGTTSRDEENMTIDKESDQETVGSQKIVPETEKTVDKHEDR